MIEVRLTFEHQLPLPRARAGDDPNDASPLDIILNSLGAYPDPASLMELAEVEAAKDWDDSDQLLPRAEYIRIHRSYYLNPI